ncbi:MAG TPA: N-acetylmuramoyl-L-alanine amidase [Acidimicrobiales bacterium]
MLALGLLLAAACSGSPGGSADAAIDAATASTIEAATTLVPTPTTSPATTTSTMPTPSRPSPTSTTASARPAPTTSPSLPSSTASLAGKVVVLDPGHNEHNGAHTTEINQLVDVITGRKACDTTGTATNAGYSEARFTTQVAAGVATRLRARGATVVFTRDASTPWGPCITERAAIGNAASADVALSIHADGGPASGRGFHVIQPGLVAGHNDAIIGPSAAFGKVLHDTYEAEADIPPATYIGTNGFDTRTDLGGLNLSTVPKVFIECGNMRNATDAALLVGDASQARIAQAIADGIGRYLTS